MAEIPTQMFAVSQTPWHNQANMLVDAPTVAEGMKLVGADFEIETVPCYQPAAENEYTVVPDMQVVRRADTKHVFAVTTTNYKPLQPAKQFDFFQDWIDAGLCKLHTGGVLRHGAKVWCLAQLNLPNETVVKNDEVSPFVMVSNGNDGTMAVRVGFTPIRVFCANTLYAAHNDASSQFVRIRHGAKVAQRLDQMKEVMNLAKARFEATAEQYRFLASKYYNQSDIVKYVHRLLAPEVEMKDLSTRTRNQLVECVKLAASGYGNQAVAGTWWAAYNGFNQWLNYERGNNAETRLENLWFGQAKKLNAEAFELAMDMAA